MRTSLSHGQATPNEDDISPRKLKIKFEKCDIMKTSLKAQTLLELNRMMSQGQLYLDKPYLIFVPAKIMCCITQNKGLVHKSMATCFSTYKTLV